MLFTNIYIYIFYLKRDLMFVKDAAVVLYAYFVSKTVRLYINSPLVTKKKNSISTATCICL